MAQSDRSQWLTSADASTPLNAESIQQSSVSSLQNNKFKYYSSNNNNIDHDNVDMMNEKVNTPPFMLNTDSLKSCECWKWPGCVTNCTSGKYHYYHCYYYYV
ncbi:unnamed protein product [Trichobilharzia regenti]|nr:unnamed protein product [Trichobilharzia regenti]